MKYLAICYIDSWHIVGGHFPSFFHQTKGYDTPEEAINEVLNHFEKYKYNLSEVKKDPTRVTGYADNREFEIRIISSVDF